MRLACIKGYRATHPARKRAAQHLSQPAFRITVGKAIVTGCLTCQSPLECQFAIDRREIADIRKQLTELEVSESDLERLALPLSRQHEFAQHAHELLMDYTDAGLPDPGTDKIIKGIQIEINAWINDIIFGPGNYDENLSSNE
jgi:hypothetical protein